MNHEANAITSLNNPRHTPTAAEIIHGVAHQDANIIFGAVIDDTLGDEVRVTVIAAGFDGGLPPARRAGSKPVTKGDVEETPLAVEAARAAGALVIVVVCNPLPLTSPLELAALARATV